MKGVNFVLGLILLLSLAGGAFASEQVVILNSNDWHELYLGSIYAGSIGADVMFFSSLAEAQRKTETLPKWDKIIVFESEDNPVYKSFSNYLDTKKYSNYSVLEFKDYSDLQEILFLEGNYSKFVIFDPDFGVEALTFATYALRNNYGTLFIDNSNVRKISSVVNKADDLIIAGRLPLVIRDEFGIASVEFNDFPNKNAREISIMVANEIGSDWGILANPQKFDLNFLIQSNPIFLYLGDTLEIANSLKDTPVYKLEVGGNGLADISKTIERESGKDLKLLVKYGQTITNLPGFEGKILDMDSISVDFPFANLELNGASYYTDEGVLMVGITNKGNVPTQFYITAEFGSQIYSTDSFVVVPVGETISVPFVVEETDAEIVNLDIQYDSSDELRFKLYSDTGLPIITENVSYFAESTGVDILFYKAEFDSKGRMLITYKNPTDFAVLVRSELLLKNELISSSNVISVPPNSKSKVVLQVPYSRYDEFRSFETKLKTYYGVEDTIFVKEDVVKVDLLSNLLWYGVGGIILVLIVLINILYLILKRRR